MAENPSTVLRTSGLMAVIEPDPYQSGAFILVVDGTPQSHVFVDDEGELFFEYVRRIGHVVDQIGLPGEPLTAVHLGAGALTLPRYIEATRPGSRQPPSSAHLLISGDACHRQSAATARVTLLTSGGVTFLNGTYNGLVR